MSGNKEIGNRLRKLRKEDGLKQADIAEMLDITPAGYGKYENGERDLSTAYVVDLAELYGVSCDYILRGKIC